MRIVIDLQGAQSESRTRGIGRYSLALAQGIARNRGVHEVIIALSDAFPETIIPIRRAFKDLLEPENFKIWHAYGPLNESVADNDVRRQRASIIYRNFLMSLEPDFIHVSSLFEGFGDDVVIAPDLASAGALTSVTLYDLIPLHDPERHLAHNARWQSMYLRKIEELSRYDLLLAISDFTAQDAEQRLKYSGHLAPISAACSEIFEPKRLDKEAKAELLSRLGISVPFVLTSGTIEPHKNLERLFAAFARLPDKLRDTHKLVLLGNFIETQFPVLNKMLANAGLNKDALVIPGYISDDDLVSLYSCCDLMVFPSMDEGFGLPALEAMTCGAPTVGSKAASITEVIGWDDAMFDPLDVDSMSKLIEKALADQNFKKALGVHSLAQSKLFSWDRTSKKTITAMERVFSDRRMLIRPVADPLNQCCLELATTELDISTRYSFAQSLAASFPDKDADRRLFVDISELAMSDAGTGIQRVVRSLLTQLLNMPLPGYSVVPVYATSNIEGYRKCAVTIDQRIEITTSDDDRIIDFAHGDIFLGLDLPPTIILLQKNFLDRMKRHGVEIRFVVYDLLPILLPQYFSKDHPSLFERWLHAIADFDGIIAISRSVAEEYRVWYDDTQVEKNPDFAFDWAHIGSDFVAATTSQGLPDNIDEILAQLREAPVFLVVGTIEPRKGHRQIFAAMDLLLESGTAANLVFVGKAGWENKDLVTDFRRRHKNSDRFYWFEQASDEFLELLYEKAQCLVFASRGEGFGLPIVEASKRNVPVLVRDLPVFREVAGDSAQYFSGTSPEELMLAMEDWLHKYEAGATIQSDNVQLVTWDETAERYKTLLRFEHGTSKPLAQPGGPQIRTHLGFQASRKRILLIKLDHLGDLLISFPAVSYLRARYPGAEIEIVVGSWNVKTAKETGYFDKVHSFDFFGKASSEKPEVKDAALQALVANLTRYDIAIDLRRQRDTRFVLTKVNAGLRVGYETQDPSIDQLLDIAVPTHIDVPFEVTPLNRIPASEQILELVKALPVEKNDFVQPLTPHVDSEAVTDEVAIFPHAGNDIKEWDIEKFVSLAEKLGETSEISGVNIYLASSKDEDQFEKLAQKNIHVHVGLDMTSLRESVAKNRLCIANNSFGAHLASYMGVKVVGIYGGHETEDEWAPVYGENHIITRPTHCSPCHLPSRADCNNKFKCLDISVDFVHNAIISVLNTHELEDV